MRFILSEEQQMLRDAAMDFCAAKLPITHLRARRDVGDTDLDQNIWKEMVEMGWAGILIDESYGGSNFGYIGIGQLLEAQGKTLASTPLLQTALIGASAIVMAGSQVQKSTLLPAIVEGSILMALAVDDGPHHNPDNIKLHAEKQGNTYILSGEKHFVANGQFADMLIVAARTNDLSDNTSTVLLLIPSDSEGLKIDPIETIDSHGSAHIVFDNVKADITDFLGTESQGASILEAILDRARIGLATEMLGASTAALDMTLEYLKTRKQFGQFIGAFQALQHRAAIMFCELELTRSAVGAALSALDTNKNNLAELASLAKARACETFHLISNECVQMHGGIGMTDVHDAGLFLKRARVCEALYGGESYHRDRYAKLLDF